MTGTVPANPKIYHILHFDKLASVLSDSRLWCDSEVSRRNSGGTTIGMSRIKDRRMHELNLTSHPDLFVGDCVPFYFCPRSIMLYVIHKANHEDLAYRGGQEPILHLEADLERTVAWAAANQVRWAFTLSNAGAYYFEDQCDLAALNRINWDAVRATDWQSCREAKQAEFLVEGWFPWQLVDQIGVASRRVQRQVTDALQNTTHRPPVEERREWYY